MTNTKEDVKKVEETMSEEDVTVVIAQRREKLAALREQGNPFPNDFRRDVVAACIHAEFGEKDKEWLKENPQTFKIAGRIVLKRVMGKASFITVQDMSGRIQFYLRRDDIGEDLYKAFTHWDMGDIVGAEGYLFRTKTDELTLHITKIQLLTKSVRPLPDKFHGLVDHELRYRQRYLDLIMNQQTRDVFKKRSRLVSACREFLTNEKFMEVETPMLQNLAGGATAKPFITHHNTLDMQMYLRVAPELHLKRLIVGGFERVFEINRNFRNEGISTRHNPEFTMLEYYQAYADFNDGMDLTERLMRFVTEAVVGTSKVNYQGHDFDLGAPFTRITMKDAILQYNKDMTAADLEDEAKAHAIAKRLDIRVHDTAGLGKLLLEIFEATVEEQLFQPTFITEYPAEVSPLARKNDDNPFFTDRFELFIGGRELANGFSELNDPDDQAARFRQQMEEKAAGDDEAMPYDEDYIAALEHGMPPTSGVGIGIDRFAMLLTDSPSIRDVILFPHLRKGGHLA